MASRKGFPYLNPFIPTHPYRINHFTSIRRLRSSLLPKEACLLRNGPSAKIITAKKSQASRSFLNGRRQGDMIVEAPFHVTFGLY